ncbi:hypothetical protein LGMS210922A_10310 [Lactococcus garvieae]|nr:hypothetical protein LGMS210922A_10310 [Lactococcus garvieae]BDW51354.1 hypothetical protein LG21E68_10290 [Lactococcus garvieae]
MLIIGNFGQIKVFSKEIQFNIFHKKKTMKRNDFKVFNNYISFFHKLSVIINKILPAKAYPPI